MATIETRNKSYQRGLVLGFTMAEVALLIIFVLLITFAALLAVQGEKLKEVQEDLKEAQHSEELPKPPDGKTWEEWIREWKIGQDSLAAFKEAFGDKSIDDVKRELERAKEYVEKAREGAKKSGFGENPDAVKDTLISYGKLISAGKGTEVPSCWTREDGTVEYIYDVKLTPTGLVMQETDLSHRAEERENLPVQDIILGQDISERSFLSATSHLFEFSQLKECRFFVRVFDATGPTEKAVYKSRLKAVEARFYKFISSESF